VRILITGGAGFLGARLARTLLARGRLCGHPVERLVIADLAAPADAVLRDDARVETRVGDLIATLSSRFPASPLPCLPPTPTHAFDAVIRPCLHDHPGAVASCSR
jgi:NAD(P)-dependent dehydrogenase (short-subunit alcohol dehydrogenase family)